MKNRGFSIAEAMITLLIVSVGLAAMAPMMVKKSRPVVEVTEVAGSGGIPSGAIMFFDLNDCPIGWTKINQDGHYLRITTDATKNGELLEDMVHKHKHVVPLADALTSSPSVNSTRYGPFRSELANKKGDIFGDASYPQMISDYYKVNSKTGVATLYKENYPAKKYSSTLITSGGYGDGDNNNWYFYTSDGMNRREQLRTYGGTISAFSVCPNRGGEDVCDESFPGSGVVTPFPFLVNVDGAFRNIMVKNLPYLKEMSLVGDETRPKSISYIACRKNAP